RIAFYSITKTIVSVILLKFQHKELKRMNGILGRYSTYIYAIFRVVFGFLFMPHGTQILLNWPAAKQPMQAEGMLLVAGVIELVTGLLIMIGFFSTIAAFLASGTMAVAYFMVHQPNGGLPISNG